MILARTGSAVILLLLAAPVVPAGAAATGGAVFIKGGAIRLDSDEQLFPTSTRSAATVRLDDTSFRTIGIGWEIRLPRGWAIGMEYLNYENKFAPLTSPAASGAAKTTVAMVSPKKYFLDNGLFHPYVGGGVGIGAVTYNNQRNGGLSDNSHLGLVLHALLGAELRVDHMSFFLEAKTMSFPSRILGYDASATSVLFGMGYHW